MKQVRAALGLLIIGSWLAAGCDLLGSSGDQLGVRFELAKTTYRVGETVTSRFINDSSRPVYLVRADCHDAGIEQRHGDVWVGLEHEITCTAEVSYILIRRGEERTILLPTARIAELSESPTGEFRFAWSVAGKKDYREPREVRSATFEVIAE